jgi:hypothetical protein
LTSTWHAGSHDRVLRGQEAQDGSATVIEQPQRIGF